MADEPGFKIDGQFFPFVQRYKHGDPILIHEVTGMDWDEFAERLTRQTEPGARPDPIVQTALLAVAVQRHFPSWSRKRVVEYICDVDLGTEEVIGGSQEEPQQSPPPQPESDASFSSSEDKSSTPPDSDGTSTSPDSSTVSSPTSSGVHGSVTSTPALRQIA